MADLHPNPDRIRLAARLYYVDGLPQAEVARILEVSQANVSRFLQAARDKGIVRITVEDYEPRDVQLERELCAEYDLAQVTVIRNLSETSIAAIRKNVGYFGAAVVADMVRPGQVVGLTGGRALAELISRLRAPRSLRDLRVVQLMGSIGAGVNENDAVELSRHFAEVFDGSFYALNTPAFVSNAASRKTFLEQDQVRAVWRLYGEMTLALVGIGTLQDSAFIDRGVIGPGDVSRLEAAGAVGEICGRFYDDAGRECETEYRKRVVSIELDALRMIPQVVGITAGAGRAEAVAVALRAGLIKSLVVDEQCARAVLARTRNTHGPGKGAKTLARSAR